MRQITKSAFILSILMICMNVSGQNRDTDILSDSTKFAEYIYINMHYPLMDLINKVEGTSVYKFEYDSITGRISEIKIVNSSGSGTLDREGIRLLWQISIQENEYPTQEISINFKLADNKIYNMSEVFEEEIPKFPGGDAEMVKFLSQNLNPTCSPSS